MPTIGEVYNPLIEAAKADDPQGHALLAQVGRVIHERYPDKASTVEEGIAQAKHNLDYYCQYFDEATASKTKAFYGLGAGFTDLMGNKWPR